jgi:hypothetical protein
MMEQPTEQDYFASSDWGDDVIAAWLACFYELAGELDIRSTSVTLTFSGHDPHVMRALRARFKWAT